jgi:hypothetical protein
MTQTQPTSTMSNSLHKMKEFLPKMLTVALVLSALVAVPAMSDVNGWFGTPTSGDQFWGGITMNIKGQAVGIPTGKPPHEITGSGAHIEWDYANFGSVGNLCDPSVRFTYGNGAHSFDGNVHWSCSHVGEWRYKVNFNAPRGDACVELWAKNWQILVAKQCHYVQGAIPSGGW